MTRIRHYLFYLFLLVILALVAYMLLATVLEMPPYGYPDNPTNNYVAERYVEEGLMESGGFNLVTNIVVDYRGYDTLLETTVLFTTVMAIILVLEVKDDSK